MVLGMEDPIIMVAWISTVLSAVGCVIFGIRYWNRGGDDSQ
ncbi:symporter small accessory protein [Pseudalkalibacillus decolorationis]|nr:symporter small accessory protein [Pseudalkalibacillus decolorationis]